MDSVYSQTISQARWDYLYQHLKIMYLMGLQKRVLPHKCLE